MAETGARAARLLGAHAARAASRSRQRVRALDFLTGIPSQCSFIEPGRSLYEMLGALEAAHGVVLSFTPGFPMADFAECGMAVFGYGQNAKDAVARGGRAARSGGRRGGRLRARAAHAGRRGRARDAARRAGRAGRARGHAGQPGRGRQRRHHGAARGAGATERPGRGARTADRPGKPRSGRTRQGRGRRCAFALGGRSRRPGHTPLAGEFTVERLGDGRSRAPGRCSAAFA